MGIKQLLKFIKINSPNSSKRIQLSDLSDKKIVIDTSIYMYKFKMNGELFDNFYLLCMLLLEKSILPVFVFDGPKSFYKRHTLETRHKNKVQAMQKIKNNENTNKHIYKSIKNKAMRITLDDINVVKELLNTLGIMYMFAYGCSKILTNIDLFQETVTLYSMSQILRNLRISQTTFRELCILSGTDYNKSYGSMKLHYHRYQEYKQKKLKKGYLQWLFDNGYINAIIYLSKIYLKYDLYASNFNELKVFENISLYKNDILFFLFDTFIIAFFEVLLTVIIFA